MALVERRSGLPEWKSKRTCIVSRPFYEALLEIDEGLAHAQAFFEHFKYIPFNSCIGPCGVSARMRSIQDATAAAFALKEIKRGDNDDDGDDDDEPPMAPDDDADDDGDALERALAPLRRMLERSDASSSDSSSSDSD